MQTHFRHRLEEHEANEHALHPLMQPHLSGGDKKNEGDAEVDEVGREALADGGDDEVVEDEEHHDAAANAAVLLGAPNADCSSSSKKNPELHKKKKKSLDLYCIVKSYATHFD